METKRLYLSTFKGLHVWCHSMSLSVPVTMTVNDSISNILRSKHYKTEYTLNNS